MAAVNVKWQYPRHRLCKVCALPEEVRDRVDDMLLGEEVEADGRPYSHAGIAAWLKARGYEVSESSVRRHVRHLSPALERALEMERLVDAVERATGKRLSFAHALANIVVHRALRYLDAVELTPDQVEPEKMLRIGLHAAQTLLSLERVDRRVKEEAAQVVEERLRARQIEPEVIEAIKRDLYGL
ncbi:phage protein Gp27 family protein [Thermus hydrothermalis]|uniref:phage protein Gp27 family protein n=1 Tax=Thermus hydrothermalis TaxID=2908148 RepID=UPI001FAB078C